MKQQTVWVVSNINEEQLLPLLVDEVSNLEGLPEQAPFAIILSKSEDQEWIQLLTDLRSKKEYQFTPVFYHGDMETNLQHLFDGAADESVMAKATLIYERINTFEPHVKESTDKEAILLAYMYSRGEMRLKGQVSHKSAFILEYPLLQLIQLLLWYVLQLLFYELLLHPRKQL